ncbi:kelch-like protein 18 [Babylonia areolata]|uniref:kelch-like protein 18 n=1 Tax=Babylonia areolata TaxID=304850 RepID=UPI003FD19E97
MMGDHDPETTSLYGTLMAEMSALWKQEQLCDVHLQVHDRVIPAHRVVLAALSPYFRAMFCSQLTESQQSHITIQGFSPAIVQMVVEYAYTAVIHLTEDNIQMVLHAASVMQIGTLESKCTNFLIEQLHPSNCLGIRDCAQSLGCKRLHAAADSFCQDNFFEVSQNEEFLQLSPSQVLNLVARDALKVKKEEDVYTAVMRWLDHSPEERAEDTVKIMEKVRLPLVRWEFLMGKVRTHKLFTNNEQCREYLQQARAFQSSLFHPDLNNFAFNEAVLLAQPRIGFGTTDFLHAVGGEAASRELLPILEGYNPLNNTTKQFASMPNARRSLGVVMMDNVIYAIGGSDGATAVRTVEAYNMEKDTWSTCAPMCKTRTSVMVAAMEGRVFAIGGHDGQRALSSVEVYDVEINCWENSAELQTPRSMGSAVCLKNQLYVMGGYDGNTDLHSAEKYDMLTRHWVAIASMHESRSMCDAAILDGHIIVVGGSSENQCLSSAEMYTPDADQWTVLQYLSIPRRGLGVAVLGDAVYAAGGHDGKNYLTSIEKYNKNTRAWSVVGHLQHQRGRFGFV